LQIDYGYSKSETLVFDIKNSLQQRDTFHNSQVLIGDVGYMKVFDHKIHDGTLYKNNMLMKNCGSIALRSVKTIGTNKVDFTLEYSTTTQQKQDK